MPEEFINGAGVVAHPWPMADYSTWTEWFLSLRGNEYYCQVDEEYILDRFNLTGIGNDIPVFKKAYELICGHYSKRFHGRTLSFLILFFSRLRCRS